MFIFSFAEEIVCAMIYHCILCHRDVCVGIHQSLENPHEPQSVVQTDTTVTSIYIYITLYPYSNFLFWIKRKHVLFLKNHCLMFFEFHCPIIHFPSPKKNPDVPVLPSHLKRRPTSSVLMPMEWRKAENLEDIIASFSHRPKTDPCHPKALLGCPRKLNKWPADGL